MGAFCSIILGYLIGTINPAYIFGKIKGMDIRQRGSGNAGATNAMLTLGKIVGVVCALLDIIKAYCAYFVAQSLFPDLPPAGILAGVACILGHIFPVWMMFRGGKGLACLAGMVLAYNWKLFLVLLVFEIILAFVVNYICVMAMSASAIFTAIYAFLSANIVGIAALLLVTVVIELKHMDNVKRIMAGTEFHLSYLWDKEREIERVTSVMGKDRVHELV